MTVVVFPGQGAQRTGMGVDFYAEFPATRAVFAEASDAVGEDLYAICAERDPRLHRTEYTQPCVLTMQIAAYRVAVAETGLRPAAFGGHSLGEYTALVAAGVLDLADAVRLVRTRGRLMQRAVPEGEGAMAALILPGIAATDAAELVTAAGAEIANDNSPDQVVISGTAESVTAARGLLAERLPALRFVPLRVSAPFHSRLMSAIEPEFAAHLADCVPRLRPDRATVVTSNYTGQFHRPETLVDHLVRQISAPVRWTDNMRVLTATGGEICEIGPSSPLSKFFGAIGTPVTAISKVTDLSTLPRGVAGGGLGVQGMAAPVGEPWQLGAAAKFPPGPGSPVADRGVVPQPMSVAGSLDARSALPDAAPGGPASRSATRGPCASSATVESFPTSEAFEPAANGRAIPGGQEGNRDGLRLHRKPLGTPEVRLVCWPFAGGRAAAYAPWRDLLPDWAELIIVELPARRRTGDGAPIRRFADLVAAGLSATGDLFDLPCAFFGHSLGALTAYEVARRTPPHALFLSGSAAPHLPRPGRLSTLADDEFLSAIAHYDGIPAEVRDSPEVMSLFLPALRTDFEIYDDYRFMPLPPPHCPAHLFGGTDDPTVTRTQLDAWRDVLPGARSSRLLPGGHFYLTEQRARLAAAVTDALTALRTARTPA